MLKNVLILFMVKRAANVNIYLSYEELVDIQENLSTGEQRLYTYLRYAPLKQLTPEDFKSEALAAATKVASKTVQNTLSALKRKGYAQIVFFLDERGNQGVKVIVGKEQVQLYTLGLDVCITDAATYQQILKRFPLDNDTVPLEQRKQMVKEANEYALTLKTTK